MKMLKFGFYILDFLCPINGINLLGTPLDEYDRHGTRTLQEGDVLNLGGIPIDFQVGVKEEFRRRGGGRYPSNPLLPSLIYK